MISGKQPNITFKVPFMALRMKFTLKDFVRQDVLISGLFRLLKLVFS